MLTVEDVSHVLGIGLAHAYEAAHRRDFPTITLGSRIIVPRDKFEASQRATSGQNVPKSGERANAGTRRRNGAGSLFGENG